jgi:hypothetical protein
MYDRCLIDEGAGLYIGVEDGSSGGREHILARAGVNADLIWARGEGHREIFVTSCKRLLVWAMMMNTAAVIKRGIFSRGIISRGINSVRLAETIFVSPASSLSPAYISTLARNSDSRSPSNDNVWPYKLHEDISM